MQGYTNALATLVGLYLSQRNVSEFMIGVVQSLGQLSLLFNIPFGILSGMHVNRFLAVGGLVCDASETKSLFMIVYFYDCVDNV